MARAPREPPPEIERSSRLSLGPPPPPPARVVVFARLRGFIAHLGEIAILTKNTARSVVRRPLEVPQTIYQIESLGVRSLGIVAITALFIGMVMCIQFGFGLKRYGGVEYIPRVILLAFFRELGPTLTAVIVGGRIGAGMAAEVGAMNVTEQVDAIRALGGDPAKKLVLPRVAAAMIVLPLLSIFADALGALGAMFVCSFEYDISPNAFIRSSLETVYMTDLFSGLAKTPVFGFLIAIVGCHFGLQTQGGTEGVGKSTTRAVVVVSISVLVADFFMTRLLLGIGMS